MRKYLHEWQKPFDIGGFHFSSILQAEAILMFLNYRGNVKLIANKMGNTSLLMPSCDVSAKTTTLTTTSIW